VIPAFFPPCISFQADCLPRRPVHLLPDLFFFFLVCGFFFSRFVFFRRSMESLRQVFFQLVPPGLPSPFFDDFPSCFKGFLGPRTDLIFFHDVHPFRPTFFLCERLMAHSFFRPNPRLSPDLGRASCLYFFFLRTVDGLRQIPLVISESPFACTSRLFGRPRIPSPGVGATRKVQPLGLTHPLIFTERPPGTCFLDHLFALFYLFPHVLLPNGQFFCLFRAHDISSVSVLAHLRPNFSFVLSPRGFPEALPRLLLSSLRRLPQSCQIFPSCSSGRLLLFTFVQAASACQLPHLLVRCFL